MKSTLLLLCLYLAPAQVPEYPTTRRQAVLAFTLDGTKAGVSNALLNDPAPRNIRDVKLASDGRMYVLDVVDRAVKVFDPAGRYLFRFGEGGRGAGGFLAMDDLTIAGGAVVVRDTVQHKTETFTTGGRHVRTDVVARNQQWTRHFRMRGGVTIREDTPTIPYSTPLFSTGPLFRMVSIEHGSGNPETLFRIRSDTAFLVWPGVTLHATPVVTRLGAGGAWAVDGDSTFAYADGYTGDVTWYGIAGGRVRVLRRAWLGRTAPFVDSSELGFETRRLASELIKNRRAADSLRVHVDEARLLGTAPRWSVATRAFFSTDGALWVGVNRITSNTVPSGELVHVGDENTWAVFPRKGRAFTVMLRPLFRLTAARGDSLYGYAYDESGDIYVTAYTIK